MPSDPLLQAIVGSTPAREEEPAPEPRLRRAFRQMGQSVEEGVKGLNRSMTTGLVGAPVDMLNTLLRAVDDARILPQRFSTDEPVGGSKWLHKRLLSAGLAHPQTGSPSEAGGELLGGFFNPETVPLTLAVLVGARAMKNAPVSVRAQYEAGRAALEAGEDPARVHKLYNVGKTKEGDYYFEPPMMQTEAAAIKQFENLYPDVKLRVLRNQGDRSGYFYPTKEGGEVFAQGRLDVPLENQHNRRRVLEHELQHAVDSAEGRSAGDNPGVAYLQKPWSNRYQQYLNNAAEVRARAAEVRLDPDMRQFPLVATEPVPREMQIVKQDPRAVAAAVKEPGGMWHPEAVDRLMEPLFRQMSNNNFRPDLMRDIERGVNAPLPQSAADYAAAKPQFEWATKAIRNYLNKYAGTERDPLKDVEVPFGEGVKRWEELTDQAILSERQMGPKGEETVYGLRYENSPRMVSAAALSSNKAIESYLSHVGDYLRQNVPADKLGQYDLVRAVRETAANDARVAREMEKAAAAGMKDLPVHKEYPDGFRWVELKLPEKGLTVEQAKGVRKATEKELNSYVAFENLGQHDKGYIAIDAKGEPIRNSYTNEIAVGDTPAKAYLAGQLAQEGNQMGHCVGGYCEPVAMGESRIFSLRDGKGKAHVTVEVTPPDVRSADNTPVAFYKQTDPETKMKFGKEPVFGEVKGESEGDWVRHHRFWKQEIFASPEYRKWLSVRSSDIIQIKGKQNRAPNKEYLPYVQDFVRSGKWGEVGDLGNAGLVSYNNRFLTEEESAKMIMDAAAKLSPEGRGMGVVRETLENLGHWAKNPKLALERIAYGAEK